ncbi:MAG: DUF2326 domain-containing protein [Fibromonadaceae bacterium]|jgi:uncharacterized protein YydD (DUF2326 family)|nr:DUF2326 domain-containing protein [Fibromonadaceae bacterium]
MRLVKIFASEKFKNTRFNAQFNVVLATIQDKTNKKGTHNLGKTSLIYVIDFLLLDSFKNKGLLSNSVFIGRTFYLEMQLNDGKYLVIKRSINTASKISFKINELELSNFTPPTNWDEVDVPFDKAKEKLNKYLEFDVLTKWNYRKSITYFLRTQQDYLDVFQLNKFKGKHLDWKPFVFELLGFNGDLITQKLELELEANNIKNKINTLEQEANISIGEKDKLLGLLDIKQQEKTEAEKTIDKFNFFLQDNSISKDIIEDLDFKIQTLNTDKYRLGYEISRTEESLRNSESTVNVQKLRQLFDEVQLYFPDKLGKQYEDLEKFNKSISEERRKFLKENLSELKKELDVIDTELKNLEESKSEKLSFLTEKDTYTKFKTYQKQLSILEAEIENLKNRLKWIDGSVSLENDIKIINEKINKSIKDIKNAISLSSHAEINKIFNELLTEIVGTNAIIWLKQNSKGNVEFQAEYANPIDNSYTSEAEGTSYKKLLCMAFDLALLIHYSKNSFYRFVYHDGIIEGLDNRIKIRLLNKIKSICNTYNIQHIITLIDSDIPTQNDNSFYSFTDDTCLKLNDLDDNGKLFMQSF